MKYTGKAKIDLAQGQHRITVNTAIPLLVSANEEPVRAIPAGTHKFSTWTKEVQVQVDPSEPKVPYYIDIVTHVSQDGEKFDQEPPPPPPRPDNFLAQIRERVRQNMGVMREEFERHQTIYESGDVDMFEEDVNRKLMEDQRPEDYEKEPEITDNRAEPEVTENSENQAAESS